MAFTPNIKSAKSGKDGPFGPPSPPSMRVRTRWFDEAEHVPPTESPSSGLPDRVTTHSASRRHWRWFWPCARGLCGCERVGSLGDVEHRDGLAPGGACGGIASTSSNTSVGGGESTGRACRTVSAATLARSSRSSRGRSAAARPNAVPSGYRAIAVRHRVCRWLLLVLHRSVLPVSIGCRGSVL